MLAFLSCLAMLAGVATTTTDDSSKVAVQPVVPEPSCSQHIKRSLMLVGTLDGKVSALDVRNGGKLAWSVDTAPGPLLSSSISHLQIKRNGVLTRLIPSLDGGLYQFDGEGIEAVPFTAESLLSSSMRLTDDAMIVGGKEAHTYGIDINTGNVRYSCSTLGCFPSKPDAEVGGDILVLKRTTQTVRAVEVHTGGEKWNFSVGSHEVALLKGTLEESKTIPGGECEEEIYVSTEDDIEDILKAAWESLDIDLKVIIPQGRVIAVKKSDPTSILWQQKFDSPIAQAWTTNGGQLEPVSLFDEKNVPALSTPGDRKEQTHFDDSLLASPVLYIGMHQHQLYVQPSVKMRASVNRGRQQAGKKRKDLDILMPRVLWRPYLATAPSRTPVAHQPRQPLQIGWNRQVLEQTEEELSEHGLTIWQDEYPFDTGYYLFPDCPIPLPGDGEDDGNFTFMGGYGDQVTLTLWNWWREVVAISVVTSVLVHLILTWYSRKMAPLLPCTDTSGSKASSQGSDSVFGDVKQTEASPLASIDIMSETGQPEYVSRYYTDFEQQRCLGKGGFGVVFEAKNKIDDCSYAIKRITLNNSDTAKEKVMREVKALAKLENGGIVRYHQAWFESPPPGWQEERDKALVDTSLTTPTPGLDIPTVTVSQDVNTGAGDVLPGLTSEGVSVQTKHIFGGFGEPRDKVNGHQKLRANSSGGFTPSTNTDNEQEESGSYSFGIGSLPKQTHFDDSFDVIFAEQSEDQSSESVSKGVQNVPFMKYEKDKSASGTDYDGGEENSLSIVFEDSGCADKSSNEEAVDDTDEFAHEDEASSGDGLRHRKPQSRSETDQSENSKQTVQSGSPTRPSQLGIVETNRPHTGKPTPTPKLYLYIQMQMCQEETLKDWLNKNTLNRDRTYILDIFEQIVSAVDYVHESGLMHRDLKPSNIFFSLDGMVKVGDFGLVTAFEERCEEGDSGYGGCSAGYKHTDQVGTKLYMSPEQTAGKGYSHKVDIFSLGMILFEMFYPFTTQMERVHTLLQVKRQQFPARFQRELPNVHAFVQTLLSPDPEERPSTTAIQEHSLLASVHSHRVHTRHVRSRSRTISSSSNHSSSNSTQELQE